MEYVFVWAKKEINIWIKNLKVNLSIKDLKEWKNYDIELDVLIKFLNIHLRLILYLRLRFSQKKLSNIPIWQVSKWNFVVC